MFENIEKFAASYEGKVKLVKYDKSYAVGIVSPLMQRIHATEEAGHIVFMDTTSSVDNTNCSVTLLLCKGPLGAAVPLGIIISSGQDEVDYLAGLRILKELWGPAAFGGKGYPNSFMTDDSDAERNALRMLWPESNCLLCFFHILQVGLVD